MAHRHPVVDDDSHFIINPLTRQITNSSGSKVIMQYDHKSEKFTFEIPRYVEGHDMMLCDQVEIHYDNVSSTGYYENNVIYPVIDMKLSPDSEDTVVFTWLITRNATEYDGSLEFAVHFKCTTGDSINYRWSTEKFTNVIVKSSITNAGIEDQEEYSDIVTQLKTELKEEFIKWYIDNAIGSGGSNIDITDDGAGVLTIQ